jgi:hypothetical protein
MPGRSRYLIYAATAVVVASAALTGPVAIASATTDHTQAAPRASHYIRPASVLEYGTSVTTGGVTHGSLTIVAGFKVPGVKASNAVLASSSARNCLDDSGITFQSCLTQNYNECDVGALAYVSIISYVERWTYLGPTSEYALGTPAGMRAGGNGATNPAHCGGSGGAVIDQSVQKVISHPAPSTNYTLVPPWHGRYISTGKHQFQCGNSYVQIYWVIHPSRTWTFLTPNVCQGSV